MGALGCALEVIGIIRGPWVDWGAPWGSSGPQGVAGFIWLRRGGRRVCSGSLGSFVWALRVVGFFRGLWVSGSMRKRTGCRRVRSG